MFWREWKRNRSKPKVQTRATKRRLSAAEAFASLVEGIARLPLRGTERTGEAVRQVIDSGSHGSLFDGIVARFRALSESDRRKAMLALIEAQQIPLILACTELDRSSVIVPEYEIKVEAELDFDLHVEWHDEPALQVA